MTDVKEEGFKTSEVLSTLASTFDKLSDADRKAQVKKTNGLFQLNIKNAQGKEGIWTIDLKEEGKVHKGALDKKKPDVTMILSDDNFIKLADGSLNGQKAFMTGALKVKGNVMLATKLDAVLKSAKAKL